jgi:hypothetical protein
VTGRHISPVVNGLSQEFGDVKFLKVDLDEVHLRKLVWVCQEIVYLTVELQEDWTDTNLFGFAARATKDD